MKKCSLLKFEIVSTLIIFVLGILLHFTYNLSNQNVFVGIFSAINESTWEHLKLIFFPMTIMSLIGGFYFKEEEPKYLCTKTKGILIALSFLIIFFYTYTGIIGKSIGFLNIISFFVAVGIGQGYAYKKRSVSCSKSFSSLLLGILTFLFILFTFIPPHIGLFKDPITGGYGILK